MGYKCMKWTSRPRPVYCIACTVLARFGRRSRFRVFLTTVAVLRGEKNEGRKVKKRFPTDRSTQVLAPKGQYNNFLLGLKSILLCHDLFLFFFEELKCNPYSQPRDNKTGFYSKGPGNSSETFYLWFYFYPSSILLKVCFSLK